MPTIDSILQHGKYLPVAEDFYTIQGEGFYSGKPAYFIRLGGCDIGCSWCDAKETWHPDLYPLTSIQDMGARASAHPSKSVVITGGEPLRYPLLPLCDLLHHYGLKIFLETSGAYPLSGHFDWICLSPKKQAPPVDNIYLKASELKVIVANPSDFEWAEESRLKVGTNCLFYLQPEWSRAQLIMPVIVDYVKANPQWSISLQIHKYMNIP